MSASVNHRRPSASLVLVAALFLHLSISTADPLIPVLQPVPGDALSGGPEYDFRISRFEISNADFVAFLNNALANPDNERGQYMYFDTSAGDVYVNDAQTGEQGAGAAGRVTKIFSLAAAGRIEFVDGEYRVIPALPGEIDYSDHPVAGVSWYGALKFCNWLSIQRGIPLTHRCYLEAPSANLSAWRPVTITEAAWAERDLLDAERLQLVSEYLGYRLPMDGGTVQDSPYNEWYKAAAYDPAAPSTTRLSPGGQYIEPYHWAYGFGRDTLGPADANYWCSDDPFEDVLDCRNGGTTPLGMYDWTTYPADYFFDGSIEFSTNHNNNLYDVYDLVGNVWEWVQGHGSGADLRAYRGGGWDSPGTYVENVSVADNFPDATPAWVGLRIAQSDPGLDPLVEPEDGIVGHFSGPRFGPFAPEQLTYTITSRSLDTISWMVTSTVAWLDLDGDATADGTLDPFDTVDITVSTNAAANDLLTGVYPAQLSFHYDSIAFTQRDLELEVTGLLEVQPAGGLASSGPIDGPFFPDTQVYTLTNASEDEQLYWEAATLPAVDWVLINDSPTASGVIAPGLSTDVTVSLSSPALVTLDPPSGIHTTYVEFRDTVNGSTANRPVTVSVGLAPMTVDMAIVPGYPTDPQPDGPEHAYRIGITEITNLQFQAFLNDAYVKKTGPEGQWMFHDVDTGNVYIHAEEEGAAGSGCTGTLMFDASAGDRIYYDGAQYRVRSAAEYEPVVGLSWYGALKFCNWLTVRQGMDQLQRVYTEGPTSADWHPTTISSIDWVSRDVNATERAALIALAGYRLPMDDGTTTASIYSEWYKAAAWNHDTSPVTLTGDTISASPDGISTCDSTSDAPDVWWTYTPVYNGVMTVQFLSDPLNRHLVSIHTACPASTCNELACDDTGPLQINVLANETHWIRVATRSTATGTFSLTLDGPGCTGPVLLSVDDCADGLGAATCSGEPGWNTLYGFGREDLDGADANYWNSGDPFDNAVSPVAWFEGTHLLDDEVTYTYDTANTYGLYDLSGNVSEWMQDWGTNSTERATRGGHWQTVPASGLLQNTSRASDLASATRTFSGFRLVQSIPPTSLAIAPADISLVAGPIGGPYDAGDHPLTYTLDAPGSAAAHEYLVTVDVDWLTLNAADQQVCGVLAPGSVSDITLSFNDNTDTLRPAVSPPMMMATIPAGDGQPDGPTHSFRLSRYETTNQRFVTFLNNSLLNPNNERGQYMYFHIGSGDVYINNTVTGGQGAEIGSRTVLLFDVSLASHIVYDTDEGVYEVAEEFQQHPATGMTWYGALKYCNWITVDDGLNSTQRVYTEGPNPGDWHPVSISTCDWWGTDQTNVFLTPEAGARDLDDTERSALVDDYGGYRLPMDGGVPTAHAYNEWYKASAWDPLGGSHGFNRMYGYGRDNLPTSEDANCVDSDDPFEPGTTPVGFYDGSLYNDGGSGDVGDGRELLTSADQNAYELYDMTGNVAEWMQDIGNTSLARTVRGGHYGCGPTSPLLRTDDRDALPADAASPYVGLRVVQAKLDHVAEVTFTDTTTGEESSKTLRLLLHEPLLVEPGEGFDATGMFGGPFIPDLQQYILASDSAMLMDWEVIVTQDGARWLDINGQSSDSGELSLDADTPVDIALADTTSTMSPGDYAATAEFTNLTTGHTDTRKFTLAIAEPLDVFPPDTTVWEIESIWSGPPLSPEPATTFELTNLADVDIVYSVTATAEWITLDGEVIVEGTLEPHGEPTHTADVFAQTTAALDDLPIGEYDETITFANTTAASQLTRTVQLVVRDPLWITPAEVDDFPDFVWEGEFGGPFAPTTDPVYIIENKAAALSLYYEITVEGADWLELDGQGSYVETLPPGGVSLIPLSLNDNTISLNAGVHTATLQFADVISGHTQQRIVELSIGGDLAVTPTIGLDSVGQPTGPFTPLALRYTLTNVAESGQLSWSAFTEPSVDWIVIDGHPSAAGTLTAGDSEHVLVSIDTSAAAGLTSGAHTTVVNFTYDGALEERALRRSISLTIVQPTFTSAEQLVSADVAQPDGPAHAYMMAVLPTTNQEFVAFLNDALANLGEVCDQCERGQYMYFDALTGDVYVNDSEAGAMGDGPGGLTTKMFSPATAGQIVFTGTDYEVIGSPTDYSLHPVTGVSWYGAAKYCNWLSLDQGMPASQRCYTEAVASDLDGWHPVTISDGDWVEDDLADLERATLVQDYRGYRLPMDHQSETASMYNEWYKAAAWDPTAFDGLGANRDYGFGRDVIDGLDANFRCSGDPFEDTVDCSLGSTTPAGFFDGVNTLADGTPTRDTANAFGLYDLTGNVKEWMQGHFDGARGSLSTRTIRGGGWDSRSDLDTLKTHYCSNAEADYAGYTQVGFRVLRTLSSTTGDGDYDSDVDQADFELMADSLMGPGVGTPSESSAFDFNRDGDVDLADWASFQNAFTG